MTVFMPKMLKNVGWKNLTVPPDLKKNKQIQIQKQFCLVERCLNKQDCPDRMENILLELPYNKVFDFFSQCSQTLA